MLHPLPSSEGAVSKILMVFNLDNPGQPCNFEVRSQVETYIRRVVTAFGPGVEYLIFASCRSAVTAEVITEKFNELIQKINGDVSPKDTPRYEFRIVPSSIFYKHLALASVLGGLSDAMKLRSTVQDFINVLLEPDHNIVLLKPIYPNTSPGPGAMELVDLCINDELALDDPDIRMRPSRVNIEGGQSFFGQTGNGNSRKYFMIVDERALEPEKQYQTPEELITFIKNDFCVDIVIPVNTDEIANATGGQAFYHLDIFFLLAGRKGNKQLVYVAKPDTQFMENDETYKPLKDALDKVALFFETYNQDGLSFTVERLKTPLLNAYGQYFSPSYLNSFVENLPGSKRKIYIPDYQDEENTASAGLIAYSQSFRLFGDKSLSLESFQLTDDTSDSRWKFRKKLPGYQDEIIATLKKEFSDVIPVKGKYFKHVADAQGSLHCWMKPLGRDMDG